MKREGGRRESEGERSVGAMADRTRAAESLGYRGCDLHPLPLLFFSPLSSRPSVPVLVLYFGGKLR
jgi:hypothetical protein